MKFLLQLDSDFKNGQTERFSEAMKLQFSEKSVCLAPISEESMTRNLQKNLTRVAANPKLIVPWTADQLSLRLCANGRLIQAIRQDWRPVFLTEFDADDWAFELHTFFARIDGKWHILR